MPTVTCGGTYSANPKVYISLGKVEKDAKGRDSIAFKTKIGDTTQEFAYMYGDLVGIFTSDFNYQDTIIKKVNFVFVNPNDGSETQNIVQCGRHTTFARNVINRLANLTKFDSIKIVPYLFSYEGKEKKQNVAVCGSVSRYNEKLPNRYNKDEIPKVIVEETTVAGKRITVVNSDERDLFFDTLIQDIATKIKKSMPNKMKEIRDESNEVDADIESADIADVPF